MFWANEGIRDAVYERLTEDDALYVMKNHKHLGKALNGFAGKTVFSTGNFDNICEYMNMDAIHTMPDKILKGFGNYVGEKMTGDDSLTWIRDRFNVDLTDFKDLNEAIESDDAWKLMVMSSPMMSSVCCSDWFVNTVIEKAGMTIYRDSSGNYYDEEGNHYLASTGEKDGNTISTEMLESMLSAGLLVKGVLQRNEKIQEKFDDAMEYLCQKNALTIIEENDNLITVALESDTCCEYLRDNPDDLQYLLETNKFTEQLFKSEHALTTLSGNQDALKVIVNFIGDIQESYDTLSELTTELEKIHSYGDKIYNYEPLKYSVQNTLTTLKNQAEALDSVQEYSTFVQTMFNGLWENDDFFEVLFNNEKLVIAMVDDERCMVQILTRETVGETLASNRRMYPIALTSEAFVNGMLTNDKYFEKVFISDRYRMGDIYDSETALSVIGESEEYTRRFLNAAMGYNDNEYSDLKTNISNSEWAASIAADEFLVKFSSDSNAYLEYLVDSVVGMNALLSNTYRSYFDTERAYAKIREHGGVAMCKWALQKTNDIWNYSYDITKYLSFDYLKYGYDVSTSKYTATDGCSYSALLRNCILANPDVMCDMFIKDDSTYLIKQLFNGGNNYSPSTVPFVSQVNDSLILYPFETIKDRCMENSYFLGNFLKFFTKFYTTRVYGSNTSSTITIDLRSATDYQPTNTDIKDYNSDDFKHFNNLMSAYKDSYVKSSTQLKDWIYNSSIFIIPYMIYLFRGTNFHVHDGDIEGFFNDSVCINGCINVENICQMLCASTKLMTYAANNKDALMVLYNQASAIETAFASTANKDYMNCQTLSYNAFLNSPYLVVHTFYDKSSNQKYLLSTAGEVTVYDGPALILSITFGTDSSTLVGQFTTLTTTTKTKTYSATTEKILLFVDKLTLQNKGSGTVESITYIPLGDQPESTVLNT
jgi:hypothetical protein